VGNQALPRKILKELKRIYDLVNRRAHASNSDFTKRKFFNVTIAIVALILLSGFMLAQVMSAIQVSSTISNVGTLKLSVGVGVYSDNRFTNKITTIDWGTLDPGTTKIFSVYIRNEGSSALTLSMSASNWNPSTASNYLTLTWSYTGQTVNSNGYVQVTFTLAVSESVTGISSFSFDINLVETG
jgi:hypothetical protein